MKWPYKKHYVLLGSLLLLTSAVVASILTHKTAEVAVCNGEIIDSTSPDDGGAGLDFTCSIAVDAANCRTETWINDTSTATSGSITRIRHTQLSHAIEDCITIV